MSKEAMDWAMEYAPPMPSQLVATLSGLARHADKKGRGAYPSVARLAAYACKDKRSVQRDLRLLIELGLIRLGDQSKAAHLPEGKRPDVYDLAVERTVPHGRAGSDEVTSASRVALASSRQRGGKRKPSSRPSESGLTGDVDVTPDASVTGDVDVTPDVHVTPTPSNVVQNPETPTSDTTSTLPRGDVHVRGDVDVTGDVDVADGVTPTSPKPTTEPTTRSNNSSAHDSAEAAEERDYAMTKFGAFWFAYPRSKSIEKAKTAWRQALDRGADPDHIVAAATTYAVERAGKEVKYTPYPATWLDAGSYDDEPDPTPAADTGTTGQNWTMEDFYSGFAS